MPALKSLLLAGLRSNEQRCITQAGVLLFLLECPLYTCVCHTEASSLYSLAREDVMHPMTSG